RCTYSTLNRTERSRWWGAPPDGGGLSGSDIQFVANQALVVSRFETRCTCEEARRTSSGWSGGNRRIRLPGMCQSFVPDAVVGRRDRRNARYVSGGALLDPSPVRQTTELDTDHATISQTK